MGVSAYSDPIPTAIPGGAGKHLKGLKVTVAKRAVLFLTGLLILGGTATHALGSQSTGASQNPPPAPTAAQQPSGQIPASQVPAMPAYRPKKKKTKKAKAQSAPAPDTAQPDQTTAQPATPVPATAPAPAPTPATAPAVASPTTNVPDNTVPVNATQPIAEPMPQTAPAPVMPPLTTPQTSPVPIAPPPAPAPLYTARNAYAPASPFHIDDQYSSAYIPLDNWLYPALLRLYSLGYINTAYLGMRPWTRRSVLHMLDLSASAITSGSDEEAQGLYEDIREELHDEVGPDGVKRANIYGVQSVYTRVLGIAGTPLDNSFHIGSTIINDYGRPYAEGFNNITGFSSLNESGRFSLYVRSEYQHAPSSQGFTQGQADSLNSLDEIKPGFPYPLSTAPVGPIAAQNPYRIVEATLSAHAIGHEFSFGKSDAWLGPGQGGAFAWTNNAENIYSFRINRVEPLHIPLLSDLLGPVRYDFFVGSLKGHSVPNSPWIHAEKFEFKPTQNFEFGFERTIIWGGKGHEPITLGTFLHGFFSVSDTSASKDKYARTDPGARFSAFDFDWRLPYLRKWLTYYVDSEVHDDVTPVSAPRRSDFRTGLYLSHFPRMPKLDMRAEATVTDPSTSISFAGRFTYWEVVQQQGYTNKGQLIGDATGREAKGGQAWLTYHIAPNQWLQFAYRNVKVPHDFIPGGTTQNAFTANALLRLTRDIELNGWVQYERWKVPFLKPGPQSDTSTAIQITWYPKLRSK